MANSTAVVVLDGLGAQKTVSTIDAMLLGGVPISSGTISANPTPLTSGGVSIFYAPLNGGTNATLVSAGAHQVYGIEVFNNSSNIGYLRLYSTGITPTAGSTPSIIGKWMVPGNTNGAGFISQNLYGIQVAVGLGFTFTSCSVDTDATAVPSSEFSLNLYYK
jgi:hypothetical protein